MQASQLASPEVTPAREARIQNMFDLMEQSQRGGRNVSDEAIALSAGFIAVSSQLLTVSEIVEKTERDYKVMLRAAAALDCAGFIEKEICPTNDGNGKTPMLLVPTPELYEGIAMIPAWKQAAKVCLLATLLQTTTVQAVNEAVDSQLSQTEFIPSRLRQLTGI